jgi:hypothetical protein
MGNPEIARYALSLGRKPKVPVSVVIPVLNESSRLRRALAALSWVDEIIVVDGGSTDTTPRIAAEQGAKVVALVGRSIAAQRNMGIGMARNSWILALDADERVPESLCKEIDSVLKAPKHAAYRVPFRNFYLGAEQRHGIWGRDSHVRLFRSELRFTEQRVHESLEHAHDVGNLKNPIDHTPYVDLEHQLAKMVRYAQWGAEDLLGQGRRARATDITLVPLWRFLREYIVFAGWRDGPRGLVSAALSGCASLLKYAHLYALEWKWQGTTRQELSRPLDPSKNKS